MAGSLGTISGQVRLDVAQAVAAFATLRTATAASTGAMTTASSRMTAFGKASTVAGLALVAAFAVAINKAADFEKKMDYFGAVNNATAKEMEAVRQKALELGRTSQFSASQIADAFVEMGKAGVSAKDITDGMAQAMVNLASAADIDLAQATNIVTSQIQAYSLSAKDAAHVTDVMAGAANASIVDVSDLGVSLKYVGGVAHSLGISFDSTVDALSLLGKAGIKGSTAGTSLRQIMVSLAGGTNKAKGELEDLGIITKDGANKFFDAQGRAKSLSEIFQILQDHTQGLTEKQRLMAFRTIFNNRALAAAQILTKEGAKGFADMNSEISKTTAADVAAKRLDNLSGDIQKLKGNIDTMLIEAGSPFQNFLRGIVQGITKVIQIFANLPRGVQTSILAFIGIAGAILTLMGAIALIGGTVLKFIAVWKQFFGAAKALIAIIKSITLAMRALALTALTNPYVWIAIAVIALVAALIILYNKSEAFRNIMDAIGRGLKTAFFATVEWFKGLPAFFSGVWKDISNWFKTGVDWVKKNWDLLLVIFTGPIGLIILIIHRFGDDIVNFLKAIPGQVVGFLESAWNGFVTFMQNLPYLIGFAIGYVLGTLVKWGIQVGEWAYQAGAAIVNAIVWFFTEMPGELWALLVEAWNGFITWGGNMLTSAQNTAINVYNAIVLWFQKLPGRIWAFLVDMKNKAVAAWNATVSAATQFAINAYNGIVNWFQKLPGRIWGFLVDAKNKVTTAGTNFYNAAVSLGKRAYNGVVNSLTGLPGKVWSILGSVKDQFLKMVSSAFSAAKNFAGGLWDGFKSGLGIHSPSYIERAMWAITDVTDAESKKLGKQVSTLQSMAGTIAEENPAKAIQATSTSTISTLTKQLQAQAMTLRSAAQTMFPMTGSLTAKASSNNSGTASDLLQSDRDITVNVYNPVAETTSDSAAKKLRTLSSMGAF